MSLRQPIPVKNVVVQIPYQQTGDRQFNQYQKALADALTGITTNPANIGSILTSISLVTGVTNYIPHKLDRVLQGWHCVRIRGQATIWDSQDSISTSTDYPPNKYLALNTSANVTIDILVF